MISKKKYCVQNDGDCSTCSLVNYGRDCMNEPVFRGVRSLDFKEWVDYWLIQSSEACAGCNEDIFFKDQAFEHSDHDGLFCRACANLFASGALPPLL